VHVFDVIRAYRLLLVAIKVFGALMNTNGSVGGLNSSSLAWSA
jgi:hypothetical protein